MKVEEIMSQNVICVSVPGRRKTALEVMKKNMVSGLPVIKKDTDEIVGFVSMEDLIENPDEDQLAMIMDRKVISISPKESIEKAASVMLESRVRSLPVVDKGHLKGIVTVDDIVKRAIYKLDIQEKVKNLMNENVLAVWQETLIPVVLKIVNLEGSQSAVVLDDFGKLSGIVDAEDFVRASEIVNKMKKSDIQTQSEGEDWAWETKSTLYIGTESLSLPRDPVKSIMTPDVVTITQNSTVTECAKRMRRHDIEQLPVINAKGELIGIVRDLDLIKTLVKE
ncbi:MAG: CBS domain-containing protein [Candidatus Methanofastidiosia archaeon]